MEMLSENLDTKIIIQNKFNYTHIFIRQLNLQYNFLKN
jgi:hypothetical protein